LPGQLHLWTLCSDEPPLAQSAAAQSLARFALSRHFRVAEHDWRFARDAQGRPYIAWPRLEPAPHFSISHTRGMLACLVSLTASAAVDVEHIVHTGDLAYVAEAVLARREREALGRLAGRDWTERFFDYWTLKEAYAKARGEGLGLPFGDIGFELDGPGAARVRFGPGVDDDPAAWRFWRSRLGPRHALAVAAKEAFSLWHTSLTERSLACSA